MYLGCVQRQSVLMPPQPRLAQCWVTWTCERTAHVKKALDSCFVPAGALLIRCFLVVLGVLPLVLLRTPFHGFSQGQNLSKNSKPQLKLKIVFMNLQVWLIKPFENSFCHRCFSAFHAMQKQLPKCHFSRHINRLFGRSSLRWIRLSRVSSLARDSSADTFPPLCHRLRGPSPSTTFTAVWSLKAVALRARLVVVLV